MITASKPDTASTLLGYALAYWWLLLIFGGAILEWIGEIFDCGLSAIADALQVRHERRLELARARSAPVADNPARPMPGRCVHRRVKQVRDVDDELVGWLCVGCDKQLPADWAVAQEDL